MNEHTPWTPGPWHWQEGLLCWGDPDNGVGDWILWPVDTEFELQVQCRNPANARLIAAAPEMAEALREAVPYLEDAANDCRDTPNPAAHLRNEIYALLAKIGSAP